MKTLFRYLPNGTKFRSPGPDGDILIKRKGDGRTVYCFEEDKIVPLNAIIPGIAMRDADRTQFVHFCPADYVFVGQ